MFSTHSWSGAFSVSASHSHPKQESSPGLLNQMLTVKQGVALEKNWLVCVWLEIPAALVLRPR